jgi:hypothetical protein
MTQGAQWWTPARVDAVVNMINGKSDPPFLAQIVSNKRCGVDVDRLDYLRRDSFHTLGHMGVLDVDRILTKATVHDGELAWPLDDWHLIAAVYHTRANMFSKIYLHPDVLVADRMVQERLLRKRTLAKIRKAVQDPERFAKMTDGFIESSVGSRLWPILGKAVVASEKADEIAARIEESSGRSIVVLKRKWWSEGGRMIDVPLIRGNGGSVARVKVGSHIEQEVAKETQLLVVRRDGVPKRPDEYLKKLSESARV